MIYGSAKVSDTGEYAKEWAWGEYKDEDCEMRMEG